MKRLLAYLFIVLGLLWSNIVFADSKKPIVIPTHNWSSQVVMAYVIGGIFEAMGNNVKYVPADSQAVYESIRRGDVSISHEVWQSAFGKSFDNAMDKGGIIDAGAHVARTLEDMGVPNWVIEKELCPGLPNWEALKNSDCARNFKQSGGKGVWLEGPQSWHGDLIPQRLEALGLGDLWKVKFAGGADALWAELAAAKREGRGTIIFNWTPNFTDMEGFTMIKFPPYYNGCRPADGGDGRCGSPDGYLKKAASSKFAKNHPNAFKAFKKINFTTLDIGTMAGYVDVDKMTHEAAAKKWLRDNRHKWKYWIGRSNVVYDAVKQQRIDQKYPRIKTAKKEQSQTTDIKIFKKVTTELAGGQGRRFHGHTWKGYVVSKEYYCQEALKAGMPNWGNELYTKKGCRGTTLIAKKVVSYDWVAVTKHPKSNTDFIATRLSTEQKAIDLAMSKCYKFVSSNLGNVGSQDCYLSTSFNEKEDPNQLQQVLKKKNNQTQRVANLGKSLGSIGGAIHNFKGHIWNGKIVLQSYYCQEALKAGMPNWGDELYRKKGCYETTQIAKIEQSQTTDIKIFKKVTTELAGGQGRRFHGHTWKGYVVSKEYYCQEALKAGMPNWGNELYTKKGCYESSKTKIVKKTTQEEFKPEDKDIDNDPPVIEIAEAITVNDSNYEIEGKVSDKGSDKIYVKVDGRNVVVKKGKFKIKRYSPVDEQIEIVAIDQWGNKSKPKLVNIIIDIQETVVVKKLEPLNPSKIRSKSSNNKVALIIGIENYAESPKATYANLDAKYFFDYARKAFGVKKQNINLLIDDKATLGSINKVLFKWLVGKIKPNQTDLIIFFAGHGLASNDGKELYFLPQDADPDLLSIMALSRTKLFEQIIKLNPKSVTMFLDTCYSGVSRDEQMLLASARPIRIVADEQEGIPDNFTIFSATELDQISSGLKEAKHGIFSYYLMKGLEGKADINKDKQITNGELLAYMDLNVSQKAAVLGRQQNPSLAGDPDKVLMRYQ